MDFVSPFMMVGTALGSIPIIIHLLHKRRFVRRAWAAMDWLLQSHKQSKRRLRVEELLLLIIRALILILLAMALARPFWQAAAGALSGATRTYRIIVLDRSMSMSRTSGTDQSFDRAKELARFLLAEPSKISEGDDIGLIVFDATPEVIIKSTSDLTAAGEEIAGIEATDGASNAPRALAAALELAISDASKNPRKQIFLVTDMTAEAWRGAGGLKDQSVTKAIAAAAAADIEIFIVGTEDQPGENLSISGLSPEDKLVAAGLPVRITASVKSHGASEAKPVSVSLFVDGAKTGHQEIVVQPGEATAVSFPQVFPEPGLKVLTATIGADELRPDDECRAVIEARPDLVIMCVDGDIRPDPLSSETALLVRALNPGGAVHPSERSPLRPEVIPASNLEEAPLEQADVIILANVGLISARKAAVLERYVSAGGGLIIFPGDRLDPELWNDRLWRDGEGVLPAEVVEIEEVKLQGLRARGFDHPVMRVFRGVGRSGLSTTSVTRRVKWKDAEARADVKVILEFSDGAPALLEKTIGRGRVIVCSVTADKEWSDLPEKPAYLPLTHELAYHCARSSWSALNLTVGERYSAPVAASDYASTMKVLMPGDHVEETSPEAAGGGFEIRFDGTRKGGIYRIEGGKRTAEGARPHVFAVNPEPDESRLDLIADSPGDFEKELQALLPRANLHVVADRREITAAVTRTLSGVEFWRWLITAVLALLVIESILAWRFGARRAIPGRS